MNKVTASKTRRKLLIKGLFIEQTKIKIQKKRTNNVMTSIASQTFLKIYNNLEHIVLC